ncbi:MAG: efflux RND transporter periplasmic adaptor subunit, partial [Gammaproteobacteria bacterium]
ACFVSMAVTADSDQSVQAEMTPIPEKEHAENEEKQAPHEETGIARDNPALLRAGVEVSPVEEMRLSNEIRAPGEVVVNKYRSSKVTPRITAQIIARHVRLGDAVQQGQALVTLSSVEMADTQGELLVTDREWKRMQELGAKVVSERRYVEAQVVRQRAYAKVLAYGMTDNQIEALLGARDASRANGTFDLLAPQDGLVVADDFILGEVVEPGRVLVSLTDENTIWVEAHLRPEEAVQFTSGALARVSRDGKRWIDGHVIQLHHRLEENTRTQSVRIQVENRDHVLHPGQFVDVALSVGSMDQMPAVPDEAVVLLNGRPVVFKIESNRYVPVPVDAGDSAGGWTAILSGLEPGDEIVSRGAFQIKSLILKSEMGSEHRH